MRIRLFFGSTLLVTGLIALACGPAKKPPPKEPTIVETVADAGADADAEPPAPKSLFERLGGKDALTKVADSLVTHGAANPKLKARFAKFKGDKAEKLKVDLAEHFCEITGGECKSAGNPLKEVFKGAKVKDDEWNALVADLKTSLDENKIPADEQGDFVALVAPMKDELVETKPKK